MRFPALLWVAWAIMVAPATGATYVVRPDGTGDFPTIQAAIDAVLDGDIIELTDGVFQGEGNRDILWVDKEVTVRSQSGDPYSCTLDCEGTSRRSHWGIYIEGVDPEARLEGVTVRDAYSGLGGGVWLEDSSPAIARCLFLNNIGVDGGGLLINGASLPTVSRCTFAGNIAGYGGGVCI